MKIKIACMAVFLSVSASTFAQEVKMEQRELILPTYEIGQADPNSIFFSGRVYQGAQGHIYPYPLFDILTDEKVDKAYHALYLENEYLDVCVLPEMGGRILQATDKTNGYEIFYKQTGIKPALIGMLGAWLSGGVEWNFPHHHRPSSYMAVDWELEENEDGSKTIWIGETELRHRIKWSIGVTVYPERSWVEARVRIMNRTPFVQSMLYWANVSVHSNEDYEVIFPPSTQFGTDHSKVAFTRWPYGRATRENTEDVNLAFWKNYTGGSRSIFAWNFEDDFIAGYDHGKEAGTVHVANHHIVNGKKFFLWGNNPSAEMWNKMLSDNDGHYLELMVGAYSDNQPDYSWIGPGEIREFTQRWYPIRDIRSVKNATDDAAVNLERTGKNKVFLGFNASGKFSDAKVILKDSSKVLFEETIYIDPAKPFTREIKIPAKTADTDLTALLVDNNGNVLVSYTPLKLDENPPMPDVVESTGKPSSYETNEELYFAGLRIEQFHNARLNPMDYWNEALKRDSLDSRVNTVVGIRYARNGEWEKAEKHLLRALARPTKGYTVVKDPEPHYYLGVVYQMQGRLKEAADQYWKATWYPTFQHPAYLALAQIACTGNNYGQALGLINESIKTGADDTKALTTRAYILRKLGKNQEATEVLEQVLQIDPLDYWSLSEASILEDNSAHFLKEAEKTRGEDIIRLQELLEMVTDYGNIGAYDEAIALLNEAVNLGEPYSTSPLVYYYNGFYNLKKGDNEQADILFAKAAQQPSEYVFPFRLEEIDIFNSALAANPADGKAALYLGNLLYYLGQKENGIQAWERAVQTEPGLARAYRNIGYAYSQAGDLQKAIAAYEQALQYEQSDPLIFTETDRLYERAGKPAAERLALLESNINTVFKHDDTVMRLLTLYNETGEYDKAIDILENRHFHVWEGGGAVHNIYVDAHLLKGLKLMDEKKWNEAVSEFEKADLYPENLEVGRPGDGGHSIKGFYYMGLAYKEMGNTKKAKECFEKIAHTSSPRRAGNANEAMYFKAQALRELGKNEEATQLIETLKSNVAKELESRGAVDEHSKFGEDGTRDERLANLHYLNGLVFLAEGNSQKAKAEFEKAIQLNQNMIGPKLFLKD